jgi:hypothetical protein
MVLADRAKAHVSDQYPGIVWHTEVTAVSAQHAAVMAAELARLDGAPELPGRVLDERASLYAQLRSSTEPGS